MKTLLQKLFGHKKQQLDLYILNSYGLQKDFDYVVISKNYMDSHGNEFNSIDEFNDFCVYQSIIQNVPIEKYGEWFDSYVKSGLSLDISEDFLDAEITQNKAYLYGNKVDVEIAKRCGFGVLQILRGELRDQCYMFPVVNFDLDLQLFAYGFLAFGFITFKMLAYVRKNENQQYCKAVLSEDTFNMILEKISIH